MSKRAKHKSLSSDLDRSVRWLESLSPIKKVVLGRSESCRHRYSGGYIRWHDTSDAGIKIKGYSGSGVVDIFLVVEPENQEYIKNTIAERFGVR